MKRAALYARYSSDLQSPRSCEDQLAALRSDAARRGWTIAAEYRDEAISGASMARRPGLESLLADADARRIDIVFTEALDRLSRDLADTALIARRLAHDEVALWTLAEGEAGLMAIGLKGTMNAMLLEEIARKTRRGLAGVVADGRSAGGRTYGYAPVAGAPGRLGVVEAEAAIVRRIFAEYARGESARAIVKRLNAEGVTGPRGGPWSASTVSGQRHAGNGVINNELYIGVRVWNRRRKKKDVSTGRSRMVANPPGEWKRFAAEELRLIDDDTWRAARDRQREHAGKGGGAKRPTRLLSGLLRCGVCGGGFTLTGSGTYGCANYRERGTCANGRTISVRMVEARTIGGLRAHLLDVEAQRRAAITYHTRAVERQKSEGDRKLSLEKDIAELGRRIERAVDAILDGVGDASIRERLTRMEAEKAAKLQELADIAARNVIALHPSAGALFADAVASLAEIVQEASPEAAEVRQALRSLLREVRLTPNAEGQGYQIEILGDLAALLGGEAPSDTVGAGTRSGDSLIPFSLAA